MTTTVDAFRAAITRYLDVTGTDLDTRREIYHDDAVLEFPQSGERFVGVANPREWRRNHPAGVEFELLRIHGRGELWVVEVMGHYDDGPPYFGVTLLEFRGDRVAHETIYGGPAPDAPQWRAPRPAAPATNGGTPS